MSGSSYSSVDEIFHSIINETSSEMSIETSSNASSFESEHNQQELQDLHGRSDRFQQYHHTTEPVDLSSSLSSLMKFTLEFIKDTENLNLKY